jgi:gamma-glutamylcyclotransferase
MIYYFAYGSNMNSKDLKRYCKNSQYQPCSVNLTNPKVAVLQSHKLLFKGHSFTRGGCGVAGIIPSKGDVVYGVLFETDEESLNILDRKEDRGKSYERTNVNLIIGNKEIRKDVITYINKGKEENNPSKEYLTIIIEGAKEHSLPDDYIEELGSIPTFD